MSTLLTKRGKWLLALTALIVMYILVTNDDVADNSVVATVVTPQAKRANTSRNATLPQYAKTISTINAPMVRTVERDNEGQLFAARSWHRASPPPKPVAPPPPAAPTAPPIPYTALGSYLKQGSARVFFLSRGDKVYDVKVGDVLEGIYSVDDFVNGQLLLTYRPLQIQQVLVVGSGS